MEFAFDVSYSLPQRVTKVSQPSQSYRRGAHGDSNLQQIVDKMGIASAKAQGLGHPITTFSRLQSGDQILYILKDNSSVASILKVGHKNLFVVDNEGNQNEMRPLCVLDFYVHESRQRQGIGREIFQHMLMDMNVPVNHLAIDRPSAKFQAFLAKHYNMKSQIQQVNNFAVYEGFFNNRSDSYKSWNTRPLASDNRRYHTALPSLQSRQKHGLPPSGLRARDSNQQRSNANHQRSTLMNSRPFSSNPSLTDHGNVNGFGDLPQMSTRSIGVVNGPGSHRSEQAPLNPFSRHTYNNSNSNHVAVLQEPVRNVEPTPPPQSISHSSNQQLYQNSTQSIQPLAPASRFDKGSLNLNGYQPPRNPDPLREYAMSPTAVPHHAPPVAPWATNTDNTNAPMRPRQQQMPSSYNIFGTMPQALQPSRNNSGYRTRLW